MRTVLVLPLPFGWALPGEGLSRLQRGLHGSHFPCLCDSLLGSRLTEVPAFSVLLDLRLCPVLLLCIRLR